MNKLNLGKKIYLSIFALIVAFVGFFGLFFSQNTSISKVSADEVTSEYAFYGQGFQVYSTVYPFGVQYPSVDDVVTSDYYYFQVDFLTSAHFQLALKPEST